MTERTCSVEDCGRPWYSREWCHPHYERWRTTGDVQASRPIRNRSRPTGGDGTCAVVDCERSSARSGYCDAHHQRRKKRGNVAADFPIRLYHLSFMCSVDGCGKPVCARGWCRMHYYRWNRHGDVHFGVAIAADLAKRAEARRMYQREFKRAEYRRDPARALARSRAWRAANPDRVRLMDKTKRHARRAARSVPFTASQLAAKLAYWGERCWMCRGAAGAVDHVKPLSRGGWHMLANLRPICTSCNSRKRNRWPFPVSPVAHQDRWVALA